MLIHLEYYALLRELVNKRAESRETDAETGRMLFEELSEVYGFAMSPEQLRLSINDHFCAWDTSIKAGDRVVFIPPVAGG